MSICRHELKGVETTKLHPRQFQHWVCCCSAFWELNLPGIVCATCHSLATRLRRLDGFIVPPSFSISSWTV